MKKCFEDFQISSLDDKLIEELEILIEQASTDNQQLIKQIEEFKIQIATLEKEKLEMENEIKVNGLTIDSLQEHLSFLREQNTQLTNLVEVSSEHSETLQIRNTLAVSLSQIKKLQEKVNEIPLLKKQVSLLTSENKVLKDRLKDQCGLSAACCASQQSCIQTDNQGAKNPISKISPEVSDQFEAILQSIKDLSFRIDDLSNASSNSYVTELEQEIEDLLSEVTDMKLNQCLKQSSKDRGVLCSIFCSILQKNNTSVINKLQRFSVMLENESKFLLSCLFGIQLSKIKLMMSEVQESSKFSVHGVKPDCFVTSDGKSRITALLPQFRSQIGVLHQLRQVFQQRKQTVHRLSVHYTELDEVVVKFNEEVLRDFNDHINILEANLHTAQQKIKELEEKYRGTIEPHVLQEDINATSQTDASHVDKKGVQHENKCLLDIYIKKYKKIKDDKHNLKIRYNDMTTKCQKIATELSKSTSLLLKYQIKCETLHRKAMGIDSGSVDSEGGDDNPSLAVSVPSALSGDDIVKDEYDASSIYDREFLLAKVCNEFQLLTKTSPCECFEEALLSVRNLVTEASHAKKWVSGLEMECFDKCKKVEIEEFQQWMQENENSCKIEEANVIAQLKIQLEKILIEFEQSQVENHLITSAETECRSELNLKLQEERNKLDFGDNKKKVKETLNEQESQVKLNACDPLDNQDLPSHPLEDIRNFHSQSTQTVDDSKSIEDTNMSYTQALHEQNVALEDQISVLSQWNDKHREEVEELERQQHDMCEKYQMLLQKFHNQEAINQRDSNLRTELAEVEDELVALRNLTNPDLHEELQIKVDTQSHLLSTLNETNSFLHKQVSLSLKLLCTC